MKKQLLLILLTPIILSLGWPPLSTSFLLLFGFVPLLILESETKKWFGFKIYLSLLCWNIGTTWWVWNASPEGCIAMLILNSGLMLLPFILYRFIKKIFGLKIGLLTWISGWVAMEYLHLNWEIAYPWLNLGNGLASFPKAIQWYQFTGALGGSFWILLVNALIFNFYLTRNKLNGYMALGTIAVPVLISIILYKNHSPHHEEQNRANIVVIQPNIDPYSKFENKNETEEVNYFINMAEQKVDSNTEFVLYPETGFTQSCEESYINNAITFTLLKNWLKKYPKLTLVTGTNTYRYYDSLHKTPTSRKLYGKYFDIYNSAIVMNSTGVTDIYRKSKLVPGVEKMPYTQFLSFLENYAINLGGISGSLGQDSVARVFYSKNNIGAAPLICYESIFGEYVTQFVKNGAHIIFILTNDGWWGNTPGYKHHKLYAQMRAIENRQQVVRCTNTGISCIIDERGIISGETPWWEAISTTYEIYPNNKLTFYTRYGDYIGKMAAVIFGFVLLMSIIVKIKDRKIFS